jgi:plastocyanin
MQTLFNGARPVLLALTLTAGAGAAEPAQAPGVATVHIKNFAFNPTPLTVRVGERVVFVNDDDEAHTVTATDKTFDSQGLDGAGTWQHVFAKAGAYRYFCELHPYMKALVVVLPAKSAAR